ncbi:MAG: 4Fe-4S dicluster domain-containing protein, partial [Verrucomicrobiota bacterium]
HKGQAVVLAGYAQPAAVHWIAQALNAVLGAYGPVIAALPRTEARADGSIAECVAALNGGSVDTLVVLGGNPAYDAPADLDFPAAARRAKAVVRLGYYEDETSALASWSLAQAHFLESWGDARTGNGTVVPVQPLIEPLFGGLTELEVLARILGLDKPRPYDLVRGTFGADEAAWRKFLHDGFQAGSAGAPADAGSADPGRLVAGLAAAGTPAKGTGYDLVLHRDASVDDGRLNNNGWLQEMPDPVTKVTWDNVILVSPKTAKELGVEGSAHARDGQYRQHVLKVSLGGRSIEGPVWVQPGLSDQTLGLALGYGRPRTGRAGRHVGYNAYPLFLNASRHLATGATVEVRRRKHLVAVTQEHGLMEGRPVIREANLDQFARKPDFARHMDLDAHLPHYVPEKAKPDGRNPGRLQNIYEHPYDQNPHTRSDIHQWGMVIDLGTCVGCTACVVACQGENNIPIVGKDQVARGREMHWMRIDRYYSHDPASAFDSDIAAADPQMAVQPMFCQHCEAAPCESVCPVNATVHDEEGLNVMAYNRCIGTRYCANNCPYSARRFNWHSYKWPESYQLMLNPEVSTREMGVMEK